MSGYSFENLRKEVSGHPSNDWAKSKGYAPVFAAHPTSKIVIFSQAPGLQAQQTHKNWNDKSGERLRKWLEVTDEQFYDTELFALVAMDFYFPGYGLKGGDLPPRKDFADRWHGKLLKLMPDVKLKILIGQYAQNYYLPSEKKLGVTKRVRNYKQYLPEFFVLPHPSPRNIGWRMKNPWFESDIAPELSGLVRKMIDT